MKVNSSNLYQNYRLSSTQKICSLLDLGESIILYGKSGIGKSKYLRYLSQSNDLENMLQKDTQVFYIDLNIVYVNNTEKLIEQVCSVVNSDNCSQELLESEVAKLINDKNILMIFDHAERLTNFPEDTISYLKALKDKFKYKLIYLIGIDLDKNELKDNIVSRLTSTYLELEPLDKAETIRNIKHYMEIQNIELSDDEINKIADESKGIPSNIKQILINVIAGKSIDEAVQSIKEWETVKPTTENNDILDIALKNMTKSEYLVFNEMYTRKGEIVTRDEFAHLLNPDSKGDGVSNESIDQLLSRVRKSSAKLKLPVEISTKRGVGYYIE